MQENEALAAALTRTIKIAPPHAIVALGELRSSAEPGNGYRTAQLSWTDRPAVAAALRTQAGNGDPDAAALTALADEIDASMAAARLNQHGL
jgi:hypothetical protein